MTWAMPFTAALYPSKAALLNLIGVQVRDFAASGDRRVSELWLGECCDYWDAMICGDLEDEAGTMSLN